MRGPDPGRFTGTRCRRETTYRHMRRCLQMRTRHAKSYMRLAHEESDPCDIRDAMADRGLQSFGRPPAWSHRDDVRTMTALSQVLAHYLRGDPLWDGPRTIAVMQRLVSPA
jgi:hypothetical protein